MSRSEKKKWGLISAIILVVVLVGLLWLGLSVGKSESKQTDTLNKIDKTHVMAWGVKGDTRLFGLINPKTGESEGFDVDLAKAVTEHIAKDQHTNIKPTFTDVTANSKIQLLKNNGVDAVAATMSITPEREKIVDLSRPYFPAGQSILVKKDSGINNIKQLNSSKYTLIGVVGTTALDGAKKYVPKAKTIAMPDYAQAMSALKSHQGEAITTDNAILYGLAASNPQYHVVGKQFAYAPYGLAVNKGQTKALNAVNKALGEIFTDGTYNRLIKKWFSQVPDLDWRALEK